jgi:hypothetical protein
MVTKYAAVGERVFFAKAFRIFIGRGILNNAGPLDRHLLGT